MLLLLQGTPACQSQQNKPLSSQIISMPLPSQRHIFKVASDLHHEWRHTYFSCNACKITLDAPPRSTQAPSCLQSKVELMLHRSKWWLLVLTDPQQAALSSMLVLDVLESMLIWSSISSVVTRSSVVEWSGGGSRKIKRDEVALGEGGNSPSNSADGCGVLPTALGASRPHDTASSQGENSQVLTFFLLTLENKFNMGHHLRPEKCSL